MLFVLEIFIRNIIIIIRNVIRNIWRSQIPVSITNVFQTFFSTVSIFALLFIMSTHIADKTVNLRASPWRRETLSQMDYIWSSGS